MSNVSVVWKLGAGTHITVAWTFICNWLLLSAFIRTNLILLQYMSWFIFSRINSCSLVLNLHKVVCVLFLYAPRTSAAWQECQRSTSKHARFTSLWQPKQPCSQESTAPRSGSWTLIPESAGRTRWWAGPQRKKRFLQHRYWNVSFHDYFKDLLSLHDFEQIIVGSFYLYSPKFKKNITVSVQHPCYKGFAFWIIKHLLNTFIFNYVTIMC